ncbi:MAG: hypothetical protein NTY23_02405 [Chloroflexi bacterium]|nr:hypothetical protein [Chloroflexota bacterium]
MTDLFNRAPTDMLDRSAGDFFIARRRAFFSSIMAFLRRRPNRLLSFEDVRERLHLGGPIYRGLQTVLVRSILGSLNRYQDFDRKFMPVHSRTANRWMRVNRAWYEETGLPPVVLYKVGEVYFVVDGNHRVSVAREQGQEYIEAEVREYSVRVPLGAELRPEDLEKLGAQVEFYERTGLDRLCPQTELHVTILGGYERLLEHIAAHRYFMGLDLRRPVGEEEAVTHWCKTLYQPVRRAIEESGIMASFPGRTTADMYLWVMDHRHFLLEHKETKSIGLVEAARNFIERLREGEIPPPE